MSWSKIAEIALVCIVNVGGVGTIMVWVIKKFSDIIVERLSQKYQLKIDKEKEKYKTELSKKEYVSKTRFETEFAIYRELTATFSQMIIDIVIFIPDGITMISTDEKEQQEIDYKHYIEANNSTFKAQNALISNEAFIPKKLCETFREILGMARLQLNAYQRRFDVLYSGKDKNRFTDEEYERTAQMRQKWDDFIDEIREYLSGLDVID